MVYSKTENPLIHMLGSLVREEKHSVGVHPIRFQTQCSGLITLVPIQPTFSKPRSAR